MTVPQAAWIAVGCGYALMSMATFCAYAWDKRCAVRGKRRLPERTLHLLELFGGWPGALLAQPLFRHKRRKLGYMLIFIAIILVHLAAWGAFFVWLSDSR